MEAALAFVVALAHRFGADPMTLLAILAIVTISGIIIAAASLVYIWLRSRIALAERDTLAREAERQANMGALRQSELAANERLRAMMNGKLDSLTSLTARTEQTLLVIRDSLVALHDKEEVRAGKVYGKLEEIRLDIANSKAKA